MMEKWRRGSLRSVAAVLLLAGGILLAAGEAWALSPLDITRLTDVCRKTQQVGQIMQVWQGFVASQMGTPAPNNTFNATVYMADTVPKYCQLVILISQAKTLEDALEAAHLLNDLQETGNRQNLAFIEDTISLAYFAKNLQTSKQSNLDKFLNVNHHRRFANYLKKYTSQNTCSAGGNGICYGMDTIASAKRKAADIARRVNQLKEKLYTCKDEVDSFLKQFKEGPGNVNVDGNMLNMAAIQAESMKYGDNAKKAEESRRRANGFIDTITEMIASVAPNPGVLESNAAFLGDFVRNGVWVSVAYNYPNEDLQAKVKQKQAPVTPVSKKTKTIDDMTDVYYSPGTDDFAHCDQRDERELSAWLVAPSSPINDRFVRGRDIARSIKLCPGSSKNEILDSPIKNFVVVNNNKADIERATQIKRDEMLLRCRTENAERVLKQLKSIKSPGVGPMNPTGGSGATYRHSPTCKEIVDRAAIDPVQFQNTENINTLREWVERYNDYFDAWANVKYKLAEKENSFANALRGVSRSIGQAMTKENAAGYWDRDAGNHYSSGASEFIRTFRRVSRCSSPRYIKERYTDPQSQKAVAEMDRFPIEYTELVNKCREEENGEFRGVFRYMVEGLVEELLEASKAQAEMAKFEIAMGYFRQSKTGDHASDCKEGPGAKDIAKISAELQAIEIESSQAQSELMEGVITSLAAIAAEKKEDLEKMKTSELRAVYAHEELMRRYGEANAYWVNFNDSDKSVYEHIPSVRTVNDMVDKGWGDAYIPAPRR